MTELLTPQVQIVPSTVPGAETILTPEALAFVTTLDNEFAERRFQLLKRRAERNLALAEGSDRLGFLDSTRAIREDHSWRVASTAPGLADRRVEITGPTDRKMTINAMNSGAKVWMADFEDATSPTWENIVSGQVNLRDVIAGRLEFTTEDGKHYAVGENPATIVVRPRGWHLVDKHVLINGRSISASILDFGLYLFHNAHAQVDRGFGPYFYLPKMEGHLDARLWNDVFLRGQELLGLPSGTIRATVLIETYPAAFEMEEILYELREHAAGLNAGRWDYIFSVIKTLGRDNEAYILPDRNGVTMTSPFLRAYTELLVQTCHKRGAHAIGGMAAFIPSKDTEVNERAMGKVREDKQREAGDGFDGSWVAHPGLVPICRDAFDAVLGEHTDQRVRLRPEVSVSAAELLDVSGVDAEITEAGLRSNIVVALRYISAWLRGSGAVAIFNLMEDAATAEISRCQVWQWRHFGVKLDTGESVTTEMVQRILDEECRTLLAEDPTGPGAAPALLSTLLLSDELAPFFTVDAYAQHLVSADAPVDVALPG
ncbi:MAG TPA: malate synthase A [Sporichthyaceae bacterium]|jgi:malate synthase